MEDGADRLLMLTDQGIREKKNIKDGGELFCKGYW